MFMDQTYHGSVSTEHFLHLIIEENKKTDESVVLHHNTDNKSMPRSFA